MVNESHTWFTGTVVPGSGRGRNLGWPTINVELEGTQAPPDAGVYACWVRLAGEGQLYRGALHCGPRPTFNESAPTLEIHLLDFVGRSLYGEMVAFCLGARLRAVQKFSSAEELAQAIERDCQMVRAVLR